MIVITTMDSLPDYCYDCPCHDGEHSTCEADKEKRSTLEYRPYWCPLKEQKELVITRGNRMLYPYKCIDCVHCNENEHKCYPKSRDCKNEYDLTDEDMYKMSTARCDFYRPKKTEGNNMKITVTLELVNPYDLDTEEIKKDILMAEEQIGWHYDYRITSIDVD